MAYSTGRNWLAISMDSWLLGAEATIVIAMRSTRLAMGGAGAWREAERMVAEKSAAGVALGMALASGKMGSSAETIASGTVAHYRRRVRANRLRLSRR